MSENVCPVCGGNLATKVLHMPDGYVHIIVECEQCTKEERYPSIEHIVFDLIQRRVFPIEQMIQIAVDSFRKAKKDTSGKVYREVHDHMFTIGDCGLGVWVDKEGAE